MTESGQFRRSRSIAADGRPRLRQQRDML